MLTQELLQEKSLTTQETETAFVGESSFSDLNALKVMADSVELTHSFVRVKLGAALKGRVLDTDCLGPVLDVHQVNLDQSGLDEPHKVVGVSCCGHIFHG